jgi:HflC protein
VIFGPLFVLNEGEQAVVVRFGKIVAVHTEAGLKWRSPFVDTVMKYPKKLMSWDGEPQRIPTKENQFIYVDTTARWKIVDPVKFYETVGSIDVAYGKLDDVIDSAVRTIISSNYLREAVRSSDEILNATKIETFQTGEVENSSTLQQLAITPTQYEKIEKGRRLLADEMRRLVSNIVPTFGIEVVDILPRQIKYSDELTESVYQRMIKERNQIAQAFRAFGERQEGRMAWQAGKRKALASVLGIRQGRNYQRKSGCRGFEDLCRFIQQGPFLSSNSGRRSSRTARQCLRSAKRCQLGWTISSISIALQGDSR